MSGACSAQEGRGMRHGRLRQPGGARGPCEVAGMPTSHGPHASQGAMVCAKQRCQEHLQRAHPRGIVPVELIWPFSSTETMPRAARARCFSCSCSAHHSSACGHLTSPTMPNAHSTSRAHGRVWSTCWPSAHLPRPRSPNSSTAGRRDLGQQDLPVFWQRLPTAASKSRDGYVARCH